MREFELIDKFLKPLAGKNSAGLNDDCAFFDGYCITKDILIGGVHFFADDDPYNLARKALRVNLSDLAASGAKPFGFLLGLALPQATTESWLEKFSLGLRSDITKYQLQLLGGDTVYHDGKLAVSITAIGKAKKPVTRRGAKIGDNIFVSGKIGGGWLGLQAKREGKSAKKYDLPEPRVDLRPVILKLATACIDISDGLLADLGHICTASKTGAEIFSSQIPLADKKADMLAQLKGGDDYELLFTAPAEKIPGCFMIGKITKKSGISLDGKMVNAIGYEHGGDNG